MKTKVTAELEKPETTIDNATGDVSVKRKGVIKGFGPAFKEAMTKGVKQTVGAQVVVGQFPPGHPEAGKFAVQINLTSFDTRELAEAMADRVTPVIEGILGQRAVTEQ